MIEARPLCVGCHNDFYNHDLHDGCWYFDSAQIVQRTQVGTWQEPPYTWSPEATLSCHTAPMGRHWIKKDDPRIKAECL